MIFVAFKITLSAILIAFTSWLAGKRPELAGLIVALPLVTLIALPFSYTEYEDTAAAAKFARSIFTVMPVSLTFFIPFFFADKINAFLPGGFWTLYGLGILCLVMAYFIHRLIAFYL